MATDLLHALQRRGLEFPPTEAAWDRVIERASVRRRNRRLGSALIALALFVASDAALLGFLHGRNRFAPGGQFVTPASGPSVPLTGTGTSGSDDPTVHLGSAGGPLRNDNGVPTRMYHPTSQSTPAGNGVGSGRRPGTGPARPGSPQPPGRHEPGGCGSQRFHVRCRPPSEKWRPPSSRGQLAQLPSAGSTHASISLRAAGPTSADSAAVGPRAARILRSCIAPPRAGPAAAG